MEEFIAEMENPGALGSKPLTSKNNARSLQAVLIRCVGAVTCAEQQQQAARNHVLDVPEHKPHFCAV